MIGRLTTASVAAALVPISPLAAATAAEGMTESGPAAAVSAGAPVLGRVATIATDGFRPDVAVDAHGTVTVVWATDWWRGEIRSARRPAGGTWSRPVTIGHGTMPQVAADDRGRVVAVWETNRRDRTTGVAAARRPVGGPWSDARRLTANRPTRHYWRPEMDSIGADDVSLAMSSSGAIAVAWSWGSYYRDVPLRIQAAYRPAKAPWRDTVTLSPSDWSGHPSIAVDETGDVLLAYGRAGRDLNVRRGSARGWSAAVRLATTDGSGGPDAWQAVASDASGMTVVYRRDTESLGTAYARIRPPAGAWQPAERLSDVNIGVFSPTALADRFGTLTVTWGGMYSRLDAARRPLGGPWETPTVLMPAHSRVERVTSTVNQDGVVLVSWFDYDAGVMSVRRPVRGSWSAPFRLTPPPGTGNHYWATGLFPNGDVAVVWQPGWESGPIRYRRVSL
jgi:hypothetical protein